MSAQVGIVAAGARTVLGRSLPASAAAVRARIGHFGEHPFLTDSSGGELKIARAEWLPVHVEGARRFMALARNAAKETLSGLLRSDDKKSRFRVFVGLPEARPGRPDDLEDVIARCLGKGASWKDCVDEVVLIAGGHAAAIVAMQEAATAIASGEVDLCLAGGVDSYIDVATLEWLEDSVRLHRPDRPYGFTPGEAAGFCLLASTKWMSAHGIVAPIEWMAGASAEETNRIHTKTICLGRGLSTAFDGALAALSRGERVTRLIGDLNGEPYRADELGFTLTRFAESIDDPRSVLAPAVYWGDIGAASGALFAGLAFARAQAAAATTESRETTLCWGSSEGGRRAAGLLATNPSKKDTR